MGKRTCNWLVAAGVLLLHGVVLLTTPAPGVRILFRSRPASTLILVQVGTALEPLGPPAQENENGRSAAPTAPAAELSTRRDIATHPVALAAKTADDDYFWPEQLVSHPYPQEDVFIDDSCFKEGSSVLKVWINATGKVDRIDVVSGNLTAQCVAIATRAFSLAHFVPGVKDGNVAVNSLWFVEIGGTMQLSQ